MWPHQLTNSPFDCVPFFLLAFGFNPSHPVNCKFWQKRRLETPHQTQRGQPSIHYIPSTDQKQWLWSPSAKQRATKTVFHYHGNSFKLITLHFLCGRDTFARLSFHSIITFTWTRKEEDHVNKPNGLPKVNCCSIFKFHHILLRRPSTRGKHT